MDIAFTPAPRLVHLLRGEIFLEARVDSRPFLVTTREARFNVRHDQGATRVAVLEGRVEVVSSHGAGQGLGAGDSVLLSALGITSVAPSPAPDAWTHGMLMADRMPLQTLLVASLVSGVVVYTPFMRKLDFATVRSQRSSRPKWLNLHNVLGIVTLAWVLVVDVTGVINTLALPILMLWQGGQLAEMAAPYQDAPPLESLGSLHKAIDTARKAAPDMEVSFVGFPGTQFSSKHHYAVFMRGNTPFTERLLKPALVDAETGELTDMREIPLYVKTLLSQPLHFGDYGGMPLKIVWALLDIVSIVILASGLYLWLGRRRTSVEKRLAELDSGGLNTEVKA